MSVEQPGADPHRYAREVPGFGTVTIRPVDPDTDIDLLHGWVSQERARFWGMLDADRERVAEIYRYLDSLRTHHAYLVHRNGVPVALLQTYDPYADPVGECYDVRPGDYGIHLLLGPPTSAEHGFTATVVAEMLRFVLSDPDRRRIVVEPDARNERAIRRLLRSGFVAGPQVDLPEKRAQLLFLERTDAPG
ncbi:GNAT family N-acetyltransferase [Micromonospora echinaurantiaca]|uniref:GNAT family N-acetyltransferase n=1 Tax=Micromonospora echinaurantiaca TaxID=47857 RepID=UPI0037B8919B